MLFRSPALRELVPEQRTKTYDVRRVIERLVDGGSFLELKPHFCASVVTALAHLDGRPVGIIASQPAHLVGSLTPDVDPPAPLRPLRGPGAHSLHLRSAVSQSPSATAERRCSRSSANRRIAGVVIGSLRWW